MLRKLRRALLAYVRDNLGIYALVASFFCIGIISGALLLRFLDEGQLAALNTAIVSFFDGLKSDTFAALQPGVLLGASYRKNVLFLVLTWLLGLAWFGFPLILSLLLLKGLALGFTVAFLVRRIALKGVVFSLAALLPHNLLLVPAYIAAATTATTFSLLKLNDRLAKRKTDRRHYYRQYCYLMFLILIAILGGGLLEAYITPVFMQMTVALL